MKRVLYERLPTMCCMKHVSCRSEEELYARMWKDDWATKSKREEMEAALQIERNKEMFDVSL